MMHNEVKARQARLAHLRKILDNSLASKEQIKVHIFSQFSI